jgi:ATP-binding cassette subfamily C (CFTR/MRP) protein 1
VHKGELVAVIGIVGAGKSTLLQALVNELRPTEGECILRSHRTAYVSQQAWIQNLRLRDNILFDSEYSGDYYEKTVDACALRTDIQSLPAGDLTEIGEKASIFV